MRRVFALGVAVLLAACESNPKQTVLNLDTTDRRWASRECVRHRKAAADYNDGERARALLGFADYAVPFVGTATSMLLSWRKDPHRAELNRRVQEACVSRAAVPHDRYAKVAPYRTADEPPARHSRKVVRR